MKKISIILACVIIAITTLGLPTIVTGSNTVTAEATDGIVAVQTAAITTEAKTEQSKTIAKSSKNLQQKTQQKKHTPKKIKSYTGYIKCKKAKVRNKPGRKAKVITHYKKGKKVKVTAKCGNWLKIGKKKWVYKKRISKKNPYKYFQGVRLEYSKTYNVTSHKLTRSGGVAYYNGHRETWYSQRVLPGKGLRIPGRHVANDGTIRDKDGYICVATARSYRAYGAKLMTSRGPAKVYDSGCAHGTVDIYVNW